MQHTDKMRAEFEAWARKHNESLREDDPDSPEDIRLDRIGGVYIWANAESAWFAWQASRAALVVTIEPGDCFSPNDCGDWAIWRDDAKRLLEAAGVTVRG